MMGNGEGHTVLILTDTESRYLRDHLQSTPGSEPPGEDPIVTFNRGVQRGTERIAAEFKAEQAARKAKKP